MIKKSQNRLVSAQTDPNELIIDWTSRFKYDAPVLIKFLKKHEITDVINLRPWNENYTFLIARAGLKITALDKNDKRLDHCRKKMSRLPKRDRNNISLVHSNYEELSSDVKTLSHAVICMSNSLPFIDISLKKLFKELFEIIQPGGILYLQLLYFPLIFKNKNRLLSFKTVKIKDRHARVKEQLHLEFYDIKKLKGLNYNVLTLDSDGNQWWLHDITTIPARLITSTELKQKLADAGFRDVRLTGNKHMLKGNYCPLSFEEPFNPKEHEWLNVVATK